MRALRTGALITSTDTTSLKQMSRRTQLSVSLLSQIERADIHGFISWCDCVLQNGTFSCYLLSAVQFSFNRVRQADSSNQCRKAF